MENSWPPERCAEVLEYSGKATAGPCIVRPLINPEAWEVIELGNNHRICEFPVYKQGDAQFDARSRTDLPDAVREVQRLRAENAELRKDKERLDWLDVECRGNVRGTECPKWTVAGNEGIDIRTAIDAAKEPK